MTQPSPSLVDRAECRIGTTIRDKYRIERVLGVGGMATVYLATHRNGSRAALKILHPELAVHDVHRDRFIREAYVANSIDHSGPVRVVDDDVAEDNCPFLVMELLEGETLEARRRRFGRLDVREVLVLSHALCDALGAAHVAGVVHRDIKPENLFLTKNGAFKVLDFGIARVRHESGGLGTRTGVMMGTPAFMPPEQALGRRSEIDARTDLWAVGATMFTLLSGRVVHDADSPEEMMVWAATRPPQPLGEVLPEIPLPIAAIVDKALSFHRDGRFSTAEAMRDAITQAHVDVFGEGIDATPMPSGPQSLPPSSLRLPRNISANVVTLVAGETNGVDSGVTIVDRQPSSEDAPTMSDEVIFQPTIAAPLVATRVEGAVRTQRSGEVNPVSNRARSGRKRMMIGFFGAFAALLVVFVGVQHVIGGSVKEPTIARRCNEHSACSAGERCGENGQCVVASGCVSNAACVAAHGGKPAICRKDVARCVVLETEYCRVLSEKADLQNDETVWIGAMYPELDKSMNYGREAMHTIEVARSDFSNLTGGLPSVKPGGRPRPLAIVACDDTENYERSAEHLVNEVGVPAIQGFGRSKEVLDLAARYFIPKGILALASNTASMISSIPHAADQPRMVFRVTIHSETSAVIEAALIRDVIEPELRGTAGVLRGSEIFKIAILRSINASGTSHSEAFVRALEKREPVKSRGDEELRSFVFDDTMGSDLSAKDERAIQEVLAFAPHVIIDGGIPHHVLVPIEMRWPAGLTFRPRYVVSGSPAEGSMRGLTMYHKTAPMRIMAINPSSALPPMRTLLMRHNEGVPAADRNDEVNGAPYDAFYILAYAATSLGQTPITGTNLARAVKRLLPPGEPIDVGPSGILPAFKVLSAGRNIDLGGAQTSIDFDMETGDPACDFEVNCFDRKTQKSISGGIFYRARSGQLEGTWKCP